MSRQITAHMKFCDIEINVPRRETDVQSEILGTLRTLGILSRRVHSAPGGRRRGSSHTAGISDIVGVLPGGRALFLEVKRPGAKPRKDQPKQDEFLASARRAGACVIVARSVDDVLAVLREEGVVR